MKGLVMKMYTMSDLEKLTNHTAQGIRKVLHKEDKLTCLLAEHRTVTPNKRVFYDETILNELLDYYGLTKNNPLIENVVGGGVDETEKRENPPTNPPPPVEIDNNTSSAPDAKLEALQGKIEALEKKIQEDAEIHNKEIANLEKQLQDKEAERLHFIGENAKLTNLLAMEKEEKNKLLLLMPAEAEKISVWSRIKRRFRKGDVKE